MIVCFLNPTEKTKRFHQLHTKYSWKSVRTAQRTAVKIISDKDAHTNLVGSKLIKKRKPVLIYGQFKHVPEKNLLKFVIHDYVS